MNKTLLRVLVTCETAALLVLLVLVARPAAPEPPAAAVPTGVAAARDTDASAPIAAPAAGGDASGVARSPRAARTEASAGGETLLYGVVHGAGDAPREPFLVNLWRSGDRQGQRTVQLLGRERHFAFPGLVAGTWELQVRCPGRREHRATLELSGQPARVRRDVTLEPALLVKVRFLTPDGTPLEDVKDLFAGAGRRGLPLVVVATRRQPTGNLPQTEQRDWSLQGLGLGEWQPNDPSGVQTGRPLALPRPWAGQLDLREPPPCHVSAVLRHLVLASQALAPGQTEVLFTIDPERVRACAARARVAVVDGRSGAPIAGARVAFDDRQSASPGVVTDAMGQVVVAGLVPGPMALSVGAPGCARLSRYVRLAAGDNDLGTVELGPPLTLRGTVLDRGGRPLPGADVTCARLSDRSFPQPTDLTLRTEVKADGTFAVEGLGVARYLVRARAPGHAALAAHVDLGSGAAAPLALVLEPGVEVTMECAFARDAAYLVQAVDERGALLWATRWVGGMRVPLRMNPGSYALELHDDERLVRRLPFQVGTAPLRVSVSP